LRPLRRRSLALLPRPLAWLPARLRPPPIPASGRRPPPVPASRRCPPPVPARWRRGLYRRGWPWLRASRWHHGLRQRERSWVRAPCRHRRWRIGWRESWRCRSPPERGADGAGARGRDATGERQRSQHSFLRLTGWSDGGKTGVHARDSANKFHPTIFTTVGINNFSNATHQNGSLMYYYAPTTDT
jgi:hypothetical protein